MIRAITTHTLALYLGAGLSLGLIMSQVLPLNAFGIGVYAATWPRHVYCARPGADCFGEANYLPIWFASLLFNLEHEDIP
jgi:hypothetical protein